MIAAMSHAQEQEILKQQIVGNLASLEALLAFYCRTETNIARTQSINCVTSPI